jgi:hypothetical protein
MSKSTSGSRTKPRAIIHKKILDKADEHPDASMETLAAKVPTATTNLVERVLDKYGDPSNKKDDSETDSNDPVFSEEESAWTHGGTSRELMTQESSNELANCNNATQSDSVAGTSEEGQNKSDSEEPSQPDGKTYPSVDELSPKQRKVIEAIHKHPSLSQRELAEHVGVSGATICNRANSIEGFVWEDRGRFAEAVLEPSAEPDKDDSALEKSESYTVPGGSDESEMAPDSEYKSELVQLTDRVALIEEQLEDMSNSDRVPVDINSPEFMHKIIHACIESDRVSEEEEIVLLEALID